MLYGAESRCDPEHMSSQVQKSHETEATTAEQAGDAGLAGGEPGGSASGWSHSSESSEGRPQLVVLPGGISDGPRSEPQLGSPQPGVPAGDPSALKSQVSPGLRIRLEFFDGPMDLFLHLVQQQEVDISRVSMKLAAEQYLEVVSTVLSELETNSSALLGYDLEQVSEYLVIAATLTALKSSAVLPNASTDGLNENVEPASEEFLEELRERLRLYEETKRRAATLMAMPQLGVDTFSRMDRKALLPTPEMLQEPDDPRSLGEHLSRLLRRIGQIGNVFRIRLEPVSIVSSMMRIVDLLGEKLIEKGKSTSFRRMLGYLRNERSGKGKAEERTLVIGSFLAVLELVKRGFLSASQPADSDEIEISLHSSDGAAAALPAEAFSSEFDEASLPDEVNRV